MYASIDTHDSIPTSIVYVGTRSKDKLIKLYWNMDTNFPKYEFSIFKRLCYCNNLKVVMHFIIYVSSKQHM